MVDTRQFPYSAIVYVNMTFAGVRYRASGVMIAPDEVLTAAHVVYSTDSGLASNITVQPGYDNGSAPYGSANVTSFHYNTINDAGGRLTLDQVAKDFAVLHLDRSFLVGTFGYDSAFNGGSVFASGYPSSAGTSQLNVVDVVSVNRTYNILTGIDTGAGSSGGPLWTNYNSKPSVVGLVSAGDGTTGYDSELTASNVNLIKGWVAQDEPSNPLVDAKYYAATYSDTTNDFLSAGAEYDLTGWRQGRNASDYFNTNAYLGANGDVAAAGINPLDHYDQSGWREGRDPAANFSTRLYLEHNPDVAAAGIDPLAHYLNNGRAEGRATYAAIGPASRIVRGFDSEYYLLANPDVGAAHVDPLQHFLTYGWKEGRNPDAFFNTRQYLAANPDVAAANINPLEHYDVYGWREGRNPSASFNGNAYLNAYRDVAAANIDPLEHYLQNGAFEGRSTFGA